jgi:hypothetical protein
MVLVSYYLKVVADIQKQYRRHVGSSRRPLRGLAHAELCDLRAIE